MRVGIVGPAEPRDIALGLGISPSGLPQGMGGIPVSSLAVAVSCAGHDVTVISLAPDVSPGEVRRVMVGPVEVLQGPLRMRARDRALDFFKAERDAVSAMLLQRPVDVVHAQWSYEFALGALRVRPDAIVAVHDWAPTILRMNPTAYRFIRLLMNDRVLSRARYLTCPSPYIAEKLSKKTSALVTVTPNFTDPVMEQNVGDRKLQIVAASEGFFGCKNGPKLLEAYSEVRGTHPEVELVLFGSGCEPGGEAERWATAKHLEDGVCFVGKVSHRALISAIGESKVFVHASREESFGMVLIEAMSQGTPVVGGVSSGAVPWVLGHGEAGLLCDIENPLAIAQCVLQLLDAPTEWTRCSEAGRLRVRDRYVASAVLPLVEGLYREVLGQ